MIVRKDKNVYQVSSINSQRKLLKQAEKPHNNKREIATAKKVRIIASGEGKGGFIL